MKNIQSIELIQGSNEEMLPGLSPDFPYIASRALLDQYIDAATPWHWHRAVELFYIQSGSLEYTTPQGKLVFPAGTGGFVNSNVLHTSKVLPSNEDAIQLLHLFEPELLSGRQGNRLDARYICPMISANEIEMIALSPDSPKQADILKKIRSAFELDEQAWGYEFSLRRQLTDIWLALFDLVRPSIALPPGERAADAKLKDMMRYIHAHYPDEIPVEQLARAVHISKRVCFRLFREKLHMSPVAYMTSYRLGKACQRLTETDEPITRISCICGFGSSSYFGKIFKAHFGCSPVEYRRKWHDRYRNKHK